MSKKALIIGGTGGIGLSIALEMITKGFDVIVVGRHFPCELTEYGNKVSFIYSDLRVFDSELFKSISNEKDISSLIITAGIGRISLFNDMNIFEIDNVLSVNINSIIKIIKLFYHRIFNDESFYTCVMGSIAGLIASPLFSVYAASKAGLIKFVESINAELLAKNIINRILIVAPGYITGTSFYGGKTDIEKLSNLSKQIINRMYCRDVMYIPNYDDKYRRVLEEYRENPKEFAISSFKYKMNNIRCESINKPIIGYLSGTFDLFHVGHLNLLKKAKGYCDFLIVGVHPNAAHKNKETFISYEERKAIVASCKYVDRVVESTPEDSDSVIKYNAKILFVGSDYKGTERFKRYEEILQPLGVSIKYFPYTKGTSSTKIRLAIDAKIGAV